MQLAVARWARLAAGRVPNGCELGVQLAVARWARLSTGHAMAIPARCRGCQTRMICRRDLFLTQKIMMMASDIAQIIYIQIYKHSVIYAHIQGIICHMIFFEDHHGGRARGHINIRYKRGSSDICE